MKQSCLIIAGEKSGEEHCLSFFSDLKSALPDCQFYGVGGDEMLAVGFENIYHLRDFSTWGITEAIAKIGFYFKALSKIENICLERNTKVAILIDFQTYNLKLAQRLKKQGVEVLYYVAPQAWAWKSYRAKVIAGCVHTLFTIIPFEEKWFLDRGVLQVKGISHPLLTNHINYLDKLPLGIETKSFEDMQDCFEILLLPGSRDFEVSHLLPEFIKLVKSLRQNRKVNVSLVRSSNVKDHIYSPYLKDIDSIYENEQIHEGFAKSHMAIAASGTVTLLCALYQVPTVVCYKTGLINEFVAKSIINYKWFISLANIVFEDEIFPELTQQNVNLYNLNMKIKFWLDNEAEYLLIKDKLSQTRNLLTGIDASEVAGRIIDVLKNNYE